MTLIGKNAIFVNMTMGKNKQDKQLRNASEAGLKCIRLRVSLTLTPASEQVKYKDVEYVDTLDQIQEFLDTETECHCNVTIAHLKNRFESTRATTYSCEEKDSLEPASSCRPRSSRSSMPPVTWGK